MSLILILLFTLHNFAQDDLNTSQPLMAGEAPSIRFEHIGLEDGLSQGSVLDIMQDSDGYLWMATQDGLHRYDGYEFKVFNSKPFDTTSLSSSIIFGVAEGRKGNLWITTGDSGLNRMDKSTGKTKHYPHDPKDPNSLSSNHAYDVLQSESGDLWISTFDKGLNVMHAGKDGEFEHFRHNPEDPNTLSSDYLFSIEEDSEGNILVGSINGLNRIDAETGKVSRFLYDPEQAERYGRPSNVFDVYMPPDERHIIWMATGRGIVRLNTETREHKRFVIDPEGPTDNRSNLLHKILPDPSAPGVLWGAGPGTGVVRFDIGTGEFTSYRHDPRDPHSLKADAVWTLFADRTGNMWAGHQTQGLSIFNPRAVNFSHLRHDPKDPASLAPGIVWGIYEDRNGTLWVCTEYPSEGTYLTEFQKNGIIKKHQHDPEDSTTLAIGSFLAFAEDGLGQFWIGGRKGLNRLDRQTGEVKRLTHQPIETEYARNDMHALLPKRTDSTKLWIGTAAGLQLLDVKTEKFQFIDLAPERPDEIWVVSLYYSRDGTLWVGTLKGLYQIDPSGEIKLATAYDPKNRKGISSNWISSIFERPEEPGVLWLSTLEGGLNRFDTHTGTVKHFMQEDGLPNNVIYGILGDEKGTLWMSTNKGISNFDPEDESFRNYTLSDGLIELEYNQNALEKGANGIMYFGHGKGVTAFHPNKLTINETPPQVVLSGLKLFNKPVIPGPEAPLKKPLSETEKIILNYNQREISFDFVALHYANSSRNSYAYMLEGFDEDWIYSGTKRTATYTNLEPGDYVFRVKAANADGIWNHKGASVQLSILPPWYNTWWAYTLFAVLLIGLLFGLDRWQRQRLKKEEQKRAALREAELRAEAENRRRADTEQLSMIGRAITSTLSITKVIDIVYEHVNKLMDAAIFGVGIYNKEKDRIDFPATKENGEMLPPYSHRLNEVHRLAVWCFKNRKEIIIGDLRSERTDYIEKYLPPLTGKESRSIIYLPLIHQDRVIGVITTQSFEKDAYSQYHIQLLRNLATFAAIAVDNASAYRQLNVTLNELKSMQDQLVQQEKLASLGQLTAGIAHEIKNPLNFVNNFAELSVEMIEEAREELTKLNAEDTDHSKMIADISALLNEVETNLKRIHKHGTRADGIVKSMLQHSRGGNGQMNPVDLNSLIREYVNLSFHGMRAGKNPINVEIDLQLDEQAGEVSLVEEDFSRVIINICNNAFDAMREKQNMPSMNGNYLPKLIIRTYRENDAVKVEFEDNGPGIPTAFKNKILQPFFTTKKGNEGTGLGLSITHDIIKSHNGTLEIFSDEANYTRFVIQIPQKQKQFKL